MSFDDIYPWKTESAFGVDAEEVDDGSPYELLKSGLSCHLNDEKADRYFGMAHDLAVIQNLPTIKGSDESV